MNDSEQYLEKVAIRAFLQGAANATRALAQNPTVRRITQNVIPVAENASRSLMQNPTLQRAAKAVAPVAENVFSSWKPQNWLAGQQGLGAKALRAGGHVADAARNYVVGSPIDAFRQHADLSSGKLNIGKSVGNLYKSHFLPEIKGQGAQKALGYASRAFSVGVPAYQLYNAATGPKEERGGNIGAAMANIAVSPFSSQFGLLGQAALSAPASAIGRWAGNGFKRTPPPAAEPSVGTHLQNAFTAQGGVRAPHLQAAGESYLGTPGALSLGARLNPPNDPPRDPAFRG